MSNGEELYSQAALSLLGMLGPGETQPLPNEALLEMTEVVAAIGMTAPSIAPPPELKLRLLERLERNPYPGLFSKRVPEQGPWKPTRTPGIFYKKLYFDKRTGLMTMLVKMEPGARLGEHAHKLTEQCLILEGELRYSDEKIYRAGDFTWAEAGSIDPALYTVEGNVLLIIGEP